MHSVLLLVAALAPTLLAAPAGFDNIFNFSHDLDDFHSKVGALIDSVMNPILPAMWCDMSKITLPSDAAGLPSPEGQHPLYVAIGRGTQNYTCASPTADATPQAVGALANLYDVTCIAADFPRMLSTATDMAYNARQSNKPPSSLPRANMQLLGHHYFQGSTPVFNLDTPARKNGLAFTALKNEINAPLDSVGGCHGAVPWLYLSTVDGTVGDYSSVYRVNTAAGNPPKTCDGMPSHFEVQYAANYYFFGK